MDTTTVLQVINANDIKITDWFQGIGTLIAAVGAIVAFCSLFKKDKQKQNQINKLTEIASELKNQTCEFSLQTQHMAEHNQISNELLNLQFKSQGDNKDHQSEIVELKKKELKSRNKPIFKWDGGQSTSKTISINIKNIGEVAKITGFKEIEEGKLKVSTQIGIEVPKNGYLYLVADYWGEENVHKINNLIDVYFEDSIGNKYKQTFNIKGSNAELLPIQEVN